MPRGIDLTEDALSLTAEPVSAQPAPAAAPPPTVVPSRAPSEGEPWWPGTMRVLGFWLGSRVTLGLFVVLVSYLFGFDSLQRTQTPTVWLLERFAWWDSLHFLNVVDRGYLPADMPCCDQVYFPGYPLTVRALTPMTGGNSMAAGIAVAVLAAALAAVMLWRLATDSTGNARVGATAVLFLAVAPYGVFLSAAYSESLFLAFAVSSWWAAVRRRWWLAGVLAGAATGVRVNGLFLAAGLAVMYLIQLRADRRWLPRPDALALLSPLAAVGAYFTWLHAKTGSWTAWQDAESLGWHRETASPWDGLKAGWDAALNAPDPSVTLARWTDLLTVVGGLLLIVVLLVMRRWAEVTYVGLSIAVLVCSTTILSASRYALTLFPGYVLAAQLANRPRWRWLQPAVVIVCAPFLFGLSLSFAGHQWVS